MKKFLVFSGQVWRNLNRRVSRVYLDLISSKTEHPMKRLGSPVNGWYAPVDMPANARCYCIGVGLDASFDFELAGLGAEVFSFDPTPPAIAYIERENRDRVVFHPWGVLDTDGTMRLYFPKSAEHGSYFINNLHRSKDYYDVPGYRMATILEKLDHDDIYLMKMDIEGSWYSAIPDMLSSSIHPDFFEVEYDSPAPVWRVSKIDRLLQRHGYRLILREGDNAIYKHV